MDLTNNSYFLSNQRSTLAPIEILSGSMWMPMWNPLAIFDCTISDIHAQVFTGDIAAFAALLYYINLDVTKSSEVMTL